jgi:hypothetical protein
MVTKTIPAGDAPLKRVAKKRAPAAKPVPEPVDLIQPPPLTYADLTAEKARDLTAYGKAVPQLSRALVAIADAAAAGGSSIDMLHEDAVLLHSVAGDLVGMGYTVSKHYARGLRWLVIPTETVFYTVTW